MVYTRSSSGPKLSFGPALPLLGLTIALLKMTLSFVVMVDAVIMVDFFNSHIERAALFKISSGATTDGEVLTFTGLSVFLNPSYILGKTTLEMKRKPMKTTQNIPNI